MDFCFGMSSVLVGSELNWEQASCDVVYRFVTTSTPAHQTQQNRASELHMQPIPHFTNNTDFIIQ